MDAAIDLDTRSLGAICAIEAQQIMATFGIAAGAGLRTLEKTLNLRMYSVYQPPARGVVPK